MARPSTLAAQKAKAETTTLVPLTPVLGMSAQNPLPSNVGLKKKQTPYEIKDLNPTEINITNAEGRELIYTKLPDDNGNTLLTITAAPKVKGL